VQSLPSLSITTTKSNSLLIAAISDWNAITAPSRVYVNQPVTEAFFEFVAGGYCAYHFRKQTTTAGVYTLGLTQPSGQASGVVILEIKGATPSAIVTPVILRMRRKFIQL
jgi:hypothetical protein